MIPIYRIFVRDFESCLDFSDDMMWEQYLNESVGTPITSTRNGFSYGKKYMDATCKMWREDIPKGNLFIFELYNDPLFPHWWLDKVFPQPKPTSNGETQC